MYERALSLKAVTRVTATTVSKLTALMASGTGDSSLPGGAVGIINHLRKIILVPGATGVAIGFTASTGTGYPTIPLAGLTLDIGTADAKQIYLTGSTTVDVYQFADSARIPSKGV